MPYDAPPDLAGLTLEEIARQVAARKLPPVEEWSPKATGDSLMRIAADGTWYHDGGEVRRQAMVRAFASLLTRDTDGQHWLVTPYEKQTIAVEDAAFIATDVVERDGNLAFRINTDELVVAGPEHAILARGDAERPAIYLHVRRGCEARLNRSTYEQLAAIAMEEAEGGAQEWRVSSGGETFSLLPEQGRA